MRVRQTPGGRRPWRWRGQDGGDAPERWTPEDHARRGHGPRTDLHFDELLGAPAPVGEETLSAAAHREETPLDEPARIETDRAPAVEESELDEGEHAAAGVHDGALEVEGLEDAACEPPAHEHSVDDRIERYERRSREEEAQRRAWREMARRSEPRSARPDRREPPPRDDEPGEEAAPRGAAWGPPPATIDDRASAERRRDAAPSGGPRRELAAEGAPSAAIAAAPRRERARLRSRLGLLAYLSFLVFGFAVLPRAIGDLTQRGDLPEARLTHDRIGQRLTSLRDRFLLLADDVDEQRRRVEKIRIAYGLAVSMEPLPATPVDPEAFPATVFRPLIEETATVATMARIEVVDLEAKVAALRAFEAARPEVVAFTPALSPLHGEFVLTSLFGYRKSAFTEAQEYHSGVDLGAPVGTPVLAPADGKVLYVGKFPVARESTWWRLGQVVALRHGDELVSIYGHVDRLQVRRGQTVARGDVLAVIGESGVSANPHLHYAVWRRRPIYDARDRPQGEFEPMDPRLLMLDRQWDDEDELLANAGQGPARSEYEPLPRALR